jgi:hypothetical protein
MIGAGPITFGSSTIVMTLAPHVAYAPADLRARLTVTPRAGNRSLVLIAESEDFYRSSEVPLEGEGAPRSVTVQFRGLPRGEYSVSGELRDADGRVLAAVRQDISVLPLTSLP